MKTLRALLPAAVAGILAASMAVLLIPGCSLIGLFIGSGIDVVSQDSIPVYSWRIDSVLRTHNVTVLLKDGNTYPDMNVQVRIDSFPAYKQRFDAFVATHDFPASYPKVMDSVIVTTSSGTTLSAQLLAYDFGRLVLKRDTGRLLNLSFGDPHIVTMGDGKFATLGLRTTVPESGVPLLSSLALVDAASGVCIRTVSPYDIQRIEHNDTSDAGTAGFLIGLVVDLTVVAVVTSNTGPSTPPPPPRGQGSCPFVYSYDGKSYILDSETFSGAILKGLQRTDCDRLEYLVDIDNTVKLKIANDLSETQYVDNLKVLAVDHPLHTTIVARSPFDFYTIAVPHGPRSAEDFRGNVITRLVVADDTLSWISNPAGRSPGDPNSIRDGLTLRFDRPRGARRAKVVLALRNTPWALEMEAQLLRLQGSDLERWYDAMNSDADMRDGFIDAVKREAMLHVQMWDGRSWKTLDFVPFPGPYVEKSTVAIADLQGTPETELGIRIESTAGLWTVNSVQVDFTPDIPVPVSEALCVGARDNHGNDLRQSLSGIDGTYYVLKQGDEAELAFSLPAKRAGRSRSFFLLSNGYYTMDIPSAGTPQRELLARLGSEPGAFGKYTTGLFNAWAHRATREPEDIK